MIIVLLAEGFEEIEALTPVDILRREGYEVKTVGVTGKTVVGSHNIPVISDALPEEIDLSEVEMAVFPGGMPGALNLDASEFTDKVIAAIEKNRGHLAAICAAPLVFGRRGLLVGKTATCYPGFESELKGALTRDFRVFTYGNITTAKDMTCSLDFARELVRVLKTKNERSALCQAEDNASAGYVAPTVELLSGSNTDCADNSAEVDKTAKEIVSACEQFNVELTFTEATVGSRFTTYEFKLGRGVRMNYATGLVTDLALMLCAEGLRAYSEQTKDRTICFEVPNKTARTVRLRNIIESEEFKSAESPLAVCIGETVRGESVISDIRKMPHALIAGATGMGKSVFINDLLISLLYKASPSELKLILIDPKWVEFNNYNDLPHLLCPVINKVDEAIGALRWALEEMERRYQLFSLVEARNVSRYNQIVESSPSLGNRLPEIVIVIDELSDIMMIERNTAEGLIMRLTQKARAAGIYLIIGTQRPSPQVLSGVIKANIPTRFCFRVTSVVDSRTVLDSSGADKLLSKGDMLIACPGNLGMERFQAAMVTDADISAVTNFIKENNAPTVYNPAIIESIAKLSKLAPPSADEDGDVAGEEKSILHDPTFNEAVDVVINHGKASTSLIQRKVQIGYGKAARFLDFMEDLGIVSPPDGAKPRCVLISAEEWKEAKLKLMKS